jgi:hypothetical protein
MNKLLFTGILLAIIFTTQAQTRLTLLVKADTPSAISKVDFMNFGQAHYLETHYTDSIRFEFPSTGTDVYNIRFHKKSNLARQQIWLDTGNIIIRGKIEKNNFLIDTVIGSPMYNSVKSYYQELSKLIRQRDTMAINDYLIKAYSQHLKDAFSSMIGNDFLRRNGHNQVEIARLYSLVQLQSDEVKSHTFLKNFFASINDIMSKEPLDFEEYDFLNRDNKDVPLLFNKADYYVLDLWYTSCVPCVQQHRDIATNLEKLKAAGISLIGISTDEKYIPWKNYLEKHQYTWNNYRIKPHARDWAKEKGYTSFPSYLILDKDKKLLAYYGHFNHVLEYFKLK